MPQKDSLSLGHTLQSDPQSRPPAAAPAVSVEIGQRIGNYRVVSVLGRGGMGVVFRGVHEQLSRQAAIKVLRADLSQDPAMVGRFFNEAEAVNIIGHPGIVSIFEFGQLDDKTLYIVMEYLHGETLFQRQTRERMGASGLRLYRQIASALQAAHARNIVHRDLKPENVFVVADPEVPGGERTKILDFGIAKVAPAMQLSTTMATSAVTPTAAEAAAAAAVAPAAPAPAPRGTPVDPNRTTRAGVLLGTPVYMSPEQCTDAASASAKSDVYALGVMLFELLAGQPPFLDAEPTKLLSMHLYAPPPPLRERAPEAPEAVVELVGRMLRKAPAERPEMAEVTAVLDRQLAEQERPASPPRPSRWPLLGAGAALVVTLGAGGGALLYKRLHPPPAVEPLPRDLAQLRSRAIAVLREGLEDADPALRRRSLVLLALARDGRLAPILLPLLQDADPAVQALAAEALGQLGAREALSALRRQLQPGRPPLVRVAAAGALVQLGDVAGEAALREAAGPGEKPGEKDEEARRKALLLLAERGDAAARDHLVGQKLRGEELVGLLGRLARAGEGPAREELARALGPADAAIDEKSLRVAEELLRSGDGRGHPVLLQAAERPGPLQLRASWILASLGEADRAPLFAAALADPKRPLRERILGAEGLGLCGRPGTPGGPGKGDDPLPLLGRTLAGTPPEPLLLRLAAAGAALRILGSDPELLSQDSLAWAEQALGDADWTLRREAAEVLGYSEGKRPLQLLGKALKDSRAEVRERAAWALGKGRDRAALALLQEALADAAQPVREEAMRAIGRLGERLRRRGEAVDDQLKKVADRALTGDEGERVAGAAMLIGLGDLERGVAALLGALRSASFPVRFRAAVQLAEQRLREGVPILREALGRPADAAAARRLLVRLGEMAPEPAALRPGDAVGKRLEMVSLLPYLKPDEAISLLRQAAADPDVLVRRHALETIGAAESPPGVEAILRTLLADPDRVVRTEAAALLRRRPEPPPAPVAKVGKTAAPPVSAVPAAPLADEPAPSGEKPAPAEPKHAAGARRGGKRAPSAPSPEDLRRLKNNAIRLPKRAIHGKAAVVE